MGLSALGALLALILAFMAQSPQFLARARLTGHRLDLRARQFTGYALAALVLLAGFFVAGVPIGPPPTATPTPQPFAALTAVPYPADSLSPTPMSDVPPNASPTRQLSDAVQTPQSGAFGGPPPTATTNAGAGDSDAASNEGPAEAAATNAPSPTATLTPQPTIQPTSTPTPSPTITSTPTLTPTPVEGETAVIDTGASTLWLYRMPGSQQLILARGGDTVILQPGRAYQGGFLWREVKTLEGVTAWVREEFLSVAEE